MNSEKTQTEIKLSPLASLESSLLDIADKLDSLGIRHSELIKSVAASKAFSENYRLNKEKIRRDLLENKEKLDKKKFSFIISTGLPNTIFHLLLTLKIM